MLPLYDDILWPALKPLDVAALLPKASRDLKAEMRDMWAK
jgi:hypothetical protein